MSLVPILLVAAAALGSLLVAYSLIRSPRVEWRLVRLVFWLGSIGVLVIAISLVVHPWSEFNVGIGFPSWHVAGGQWLSLAGFVIVLFGGVWLMLTPREAIVAPKADEP